MDRLLSIADVADIFNVDTSTVTRWVKQGTIDCITLPSTGTRPRYRIRSSAVEAIMNKPPVTRDYTAELRDYWETYNINGAILALLQRILVAHGKDAARMATDAVLLASQTEHRTPEKVLAGR